jgi:hypothetical protein
MSDFFVGTQGAKDMAAIAIDIKPVANMKITATKIIKSRDMVGDEGF